MCRVSKHKLVSIILLIIGCGSDSVIVDDPDHNKMSDMTMLVDSMDISYDSSSYDLDTSDLKDANFDQGRSDQDPADIIIYEDMNHYDMFDMSEPIIRPGYEPCICNGIQSQCRNNRCYGIGKCETSDECMNEYFCNNANQCVCDSERFDCRPECGSTEDCSDSSYCAPNGRCENKTECFTHTQCRIGFWCIDNFCEESGQNEDGASCRGHRDCQSGYCTAFVCSSRCSKDSDCSNNEVCGDATNVCFEGQRVCNTSCPVGYDCRADACIAPRCYKNIDCEEGQCYAVPYGGAGSCDLTSQQAQCKDNEFKTSRDGNDPYCRIAQKCIFDDDCLPPYTCEPNGWEDRGASKVCSRLP